MVKNSWIVVLCLISAGLYAQEEAFFTTYQKVTEKAAASITAQDLKKHVYTLASDEYEGRETGEKGQKLAAQYIAQVFSEMGLPAKGEDGTYFQKFSYIAESWDKIEWKVNGRTLGHLVDYYALPKKNFSTDISSSEWLFLGYGIDDLDYSDYTGKDVKDKVLLVFDNEPMDKEGNSLLTETSELSEWSIDFSKKLVAAKKHGAKAIVIVSSDFSEDLKRKRGEILSRRRKMGWSENAEDKYVPNLFISEATLKAVIGKKAKKVNKLRNKIAKKGQSYALSIPVNSSLVMKKNTNELLGENVIGYVEGTDPQLKDEIVLITAHYDHLGVKKGNVYNGADDNASGTSSVIEIIQAFVEAEKAGAGPRRTVIGMLVSGEEKGLLGSKYYVHHPLFPLENTIVDINIDMVGRVDDRHKDHSDYIYVIGADRLSTELHDINEWVNSKYTKLELDYTYNAESDPNRYYYRSDHYNFAERGIPSVFFFNGTHDDYHRASDTMDKIQFDKLEQRAKLFFYTAWILANKDKRIVVDK